MTAVKSFRVPIFGSRVFITRDRDKAHDWLEKRGFEHAPSNCDGFCHYDDGDILVFVENDDPALLAHECFHAAGQVLNYSRIESRDEELLAYLMQWIMAECLKR